MTLGVDDCERDGFAYVRSAYGMPWLGPGVPVLALGCLGELVRVDSHLHVRLSGERRVGVYHPHDVREAREERVRPGPRRSSPERVTEHRRRSSAPVSCSRCGTAIVPGELYRQGVFVMAEWAEQDFVLTRAHSACVSHLAWWEVTDAGR